ncbi:hypothetical protein EDC24_0322 [Aquisalibacillus elongatus]|uniref:Uncharacterized protein n=1 Tax=Aquisalibacillus elongatus TaxID=485577 RepID=A0A3N5CA07_9BACI|nr:hypothetical protein EDC24_0322 [Aquisalibacillus elongatus]
MAQQHKREKAFFHEALKPYSFTKGKYGYFTVIKVKEPVIIRLLLHQQIHT